MASVLVGGTGEGAVAQRLDVDSERVGLDAHLAAVEPCAALPTLDTQHSAQAAAEVVGVLVRVDPDQVGTHQAAKNLLPLGQHAEHLGRRERRVQEEADADVLDPVPHHVRQKHQLIVMYPHRVAGPDVLGHDLGEQFVDAPVRLEVGGIVLAGFEQVVEQRPERRIAVALVVVAIVGGRHVYRHQPAGGQGNRRQVVGLIAGMADPYAVSFFVEGVEPGDESAAAHRKFLCAAPTLPDGNRKAIGDEDYSAHGGDQGEGGYAR